MYKCFMFVIRWTGLLLYSTVWLAVNINFLCEDKWSWIMNKHEKPGHIIYHITVLKKLQIIHVKIFCTFSTFIICREAFFHLDQVITIFIWRMGSTLRFSHQLFISYLLIGKIAESKYRELFIETNQFYFCIFRILITE